MDYPAASTRVNNGIGCSGRQFTTSEITMTGEVVSMCRGLSRKELANTISELMGWWRANDSLKEAESLSLLARLEAAGLLSLPEKRKRRPVGSATSIPHTTEGGPGRELRGRVDSFAPVLVERVTDLQTRRRFRELIDRYHTLGYKVPFGAHLEYLVWISQPERTVVGCLQFCSAAWRLPVRDEWIGWDDRRRARNLPQVVNNSRMLLLPWIHIQNLASTMLARARKQLPADWQAPSGVTPLLVETFVDPTRHSGACYRAANWVELGQTSGRGREDRQHSRHGAQPKQVFLYRLRGDALKRLREGSTRP
jgi:Domain of unknown function (DUF4338)